MQKFNKKYLSALVVSCVATMATAQPASSSYNVAMSGDDGEPSVYPTYEQPVYDEPEYAQDVAVEGCCTNTGGIIASVLQAGLFLTGITNDKNDKNLPQLYDMVKPDGYHGQLEPFAGAIQPNQIASLNPLISSAAPLVSLVPSSSIPGSLLSSIGKSLSLKGSSLVSSGLLSGVSGLPSAAIKSSKSLSSSLPASSSIPSSLGLSITGPLSALSSSSALAPLAPLVSASSIVPSS
ncbi:MAG: hypothetical protein N4Q30_07815, partial [Neisseriaceae bacterium]|nr:hypothetical protein [Neisseriaceae bacterium]